MFEVLPVQIIFMFILTLCLEIYLNKMLFLNKTCVIIPLGLISCLLGSPLPSLFQFVMGVISIYNFLGKEDTSMTTVISRATGAVARVRSELARKMPKVTNNDNGSMGFESPLPHNIRCIPWSTPFLFLTSYFVINHSQINIPIANNRNSVFLLMSKSNLRICKFDCVFIKSEIVMR